MQSNKKFACASALLVALPGLALAFGQPNAAQLDARFAQADTNHDGKLTLEEAKAGMPRVAQQFSRIDSEGKGYITLDQLHAMMAARGGN